MCVRQVAAGLKGDFDVPEHEGFLSVEGREPSGVDEFLMFVYARRSPHSVVNAYSKRERTRRTGIKDAVNMDDRPGTQFTPD
jgi:hypothetical protein